MIKIEIFCYPQDLDDHIAALGLMRNPTAALGERREVGKSPDLAEPYGRVADAILSGTGNHAGIPLTKNTSEQIARAVSEDLDNEDEDRARETLKTAKANPDRPWGQPSPGKKRRSGAEVAEDEAYYAAHANDPPTVTNTPRAAAIIAASQGISAGEERRDPAAEAQDAADEAAETAARVSASEQLTLEDVRRAVAKWSEIVGPANVIAKLRDILGGHALIDLPEADWRKAIDNLEWAAANPGSKVLTVMTAPDMSEARTDVIAALESKTATKEEVIAAIVAYGARYDGSKDPEKMPLTKEDLPKVFGKMFGKDVTGLGSMPKTPEAFGQITAAIVAATRDNPFKREIRA